ncbi:sensor histidine kinase [Novosphingobium sp. BW1]|uniref:sensor histidine kinase n=1 Tax=Novosphingobium sp. BW1 TaxID=2592621 RepID=UPI0013968B24|nr:sensor histidine kinase [Novosphingobium sp. BW1]
MPVFHASHASEDLDAATLAHESDHHIANNLQLLMAIISAEKRDTTDTGAAAAFDRLLARTGAIATAHRHLTRVTKADTIEIGGYLGELTRQIELGCCDELVARQIQLNADAIHVQANVGAALGLITSECVLNACKYAYHPTQTGHIRVALRRSGGQALELAVEDDGIGMTHNSIGSDSGFGSRLIGLLAERIGAITMWQDLHPGTRFTLALRLPS